MLSFKDVNPASGELIAELPVGSEQDVRQAVARTRAASSEWAGTTLEQRVQAWRRAAKGFGQRASELGKMMTREMGKPIKSARGEAGAWEEGLGARLDAIASALETKTFESEGDYSELRRMPHGVVAAIAP